MELKTKLISALEKVFWDEEPVYKPEMGPLEGFQNETISFQVAYTLSPETPRSDAMCSFSVRKTAFDSSYTALRSASQ